MTVTSEKIMPKGTPNHKVKDENPQFLRGKVTMTASNTYTELAINCPVLQSYGNERAVVLEILRVFFQLSAIEQIPVAAVRLEVHLADKTQTDLISIGDPGCIAVGDHGMTNTGARTVETLGSPITIRNPIVMELTDGKGNGILYGKNQIFLGITSTGMTSAKSAKVAILYRLKEVSAGELVGILNS
jgi:hypothetical protein